MIQKLLGCGHDVGLSLLRSPSVAVLNVLGGGLVEALLLGLKSGAALLVLGHGLEDLPSTWLTMLCALLGSTISLDMSALGARLVVPILVEVLLVDPHAPERGRFRDVGWLGFGRSCIRQDNSFRFGTIIAVLG